MAEAKAKKEVESIALEDGRTVEFAGKRKMNKDIQIDAAGSLTGLRIDFRNGSTRTYPVNPVFLQQFAGHGMSQKYGDEVAGVEDVDDMVVYIDDLHEQIYTKGEWGVRREGGGGMSGAAVVIKALMLHTGKSLEVVKTFLQSKLEQAQAKAAEVGEEFTRADLYKSFKASATLKPIIEKLEAEKKSSKKTQVDAEGSLGELAA